MLDYTSQHSNSEVLGRLRMERYPIKVMLLIKVIKLITVMILIK